MNMSSKSAHIQMIYLLARTKLQLFRNQLRGELEGIPRPFRADQVAPALEHADRLLYLSPAASSAGALCYIRGLRGIVLFAGTRGKAVKLVLEMMQPLLEEAVRCPGVVRIFPNFHHFHAMAVFSYLGGDKEIYESARRFTAIAYGDCAPVPPWGISLDNLCNHRICDTVLKITAEERQRLQTTQHGRFRGARDDLPSNDETSSIDISSSDYPGSSLSGQQEEEKERLSPLVPSSRIQDGISQQEESLRIEEVMKVNLW